MNEILSFFIIGLLATSAMTSFLWLITGLTRTNVDMIKALGALYTNTLENSLMPGIFMQFTGGILMTYVYGIFMSLLDYNTAYSYAFIGLGIGLVHGIATTLVLKILLAEHHPSEEYRTISKSGASTHVFAHLLYGLVIGAMYGSFLA
jgi:hypothetical protein